MKKRFQQIIDLLLKRGNIPAQDYAELNKEEKDLVSTAKLLIAGRHEDKPYRMEFKDELKKKLLALHSVKQEKQKKTKKTIWRALHIKTLAGSGIAVLAVAAVVAFSVFQQSGLINIIRPGESGGILIPAAHAYDNFTFTPEVVDEYGVIAQNTDFLLVSEARISKQAIEDYVSLSNGGDFSVETVRRGYEYRIDPDQDLAKGEIIQISAATVSESESGLEPFLYQWVFEVSDHFKIQSSTPADRTTGVATNTAIELVLSHAKTQDISAFVQIQPNHAFRIEQDFRTTRIIPSEPWQDDTLYEVTIKSGFGVAAEFIPAGADESLWRLNEDYTIAFTTGNIEPLVNGSMSFTNEVLQSRAGQQIDITGYGYQLPETAPLFVDIYPLDKPVLDQVIDATAKLQGWIPTRLRSRLSDQVIDQFGLTNAIASYEIAPKKSYSQSIYTLDAIQNEGVYLVRGQVGGQVQLFFWSVSELGAYFVMSETKGYVWTVNTEENRSAADVTVHSRNQLLGTTNSQGVLEVSADQIRLLEDRDAFTLSRGTDTTVHPVVIWQDPSDQQPEYQGFIQLDQYLVHPDDTVKYWGLVQREDKEITELRAKVHTWGSAYGSYSQVTVQEQIVSVDEHGFFSAEMELFDLRDGYYSLELYDGEDLFKSKSFEVKVFATPELAITVNPEYRRVDIGQSNTITISTARFDGTPARFIDLQVSGDYTTQVTTNELGEAVVEIPSLAQSCGQYGCSSYLYKSIEVRPIGPFETEVEGRASWVVSQNYLDMSVTVEELEDAYEIEVDFQGIQYLTNDTDYPQGDAVYYNNAVGIPFKATVNQITSVKSELFSEVDPLTNQTAFYYDFDQVKTNVDIHEGLTNANGKTTFRVPKVDQTNFELLIEGEDKFGRLDRMTKVIGNYSLPRGKVYVEQETDDDFIDDIPEYDPYRSVWLEISDVDDAGYRIGNELEVDVTLGEYNENLLADDASTFIFTVSPNIVHAYQQDATTTRIPIEEEYYPNVHIGAAAIYNGSIYYVEYRLENISLSEAAYELDIDIQTDREEYGIRDEVQVDLAVTDELGNPVEGAMVNLNVLDKAYLELDYFASTQNPLTDLLAQQYDRIILNTATHHYTLGADGMGGGGGDGRVDFQEQASYQFVQTGSDGKAQASFTLPDNITSWVITASAASGDLQGGVQQKEVIVSQSFVVQSVQSDSYLFDDEIIISGRTYSANINSDEEVQYAFYGPLKKEEGKTYRLQDFPVASQTGSALANELIDFNVDVDELGTFVYALRGYHGETEDIVIKEFDVLASRGSSPEVASYELTDSWQAVVPDNAIGRVALRFASPLGATAYTSLARICDCATRLDYLIAKKVSAGLLEQYFNLESQYKEEKIASQYKHPDGGFARFPLGTADLELTASVASLLGEDPSLAELEPYFSEILEEDATPMEVAWAFKGLAAMKQPGYAQLVAFSERDDFTTEVRLVLADAFLLYGDLANARVLFDRVLTDSSLENGQRFFNEFESQDAEYAQLMTEQARVIAYALGHDSWSEFDAYLNTKREFVDPVAYTRFWKLRLERQPITDMSFVVAAGEESQFVTLKGFESFGLDLTQEQLAQLSVTDIRGNVEVLYSYAVADQRETTIDGLQVTRFYDQGDGYTTTIDPNKEVDVLIELRPTSSMAYGMYELHDLLPSGLQAITRGQRWGIEYNKCQRTAYRTSLHYAKSFVWLDEDCPRVLIQYRARPVANAGTYTAEGVIVTKLEDPSIRFVGESERITIE